MPLIHGINAVAGPAILTLGPGGRNIALEYEGGDPKITKDGVTVVKSIFLSTREKELGVKLVKRVANNTNTFAGDGTTSSTLMSRELVKRGFHAVEFQGAHPIALKRGMDKALKVILGYLKDIAMPISLPDEVRNVCMVSSNHNERIADIVSKVITSVGIEGTMHITESPTGMTDFKLVNGLIFNRGFVKPEFIQEAAGGDTINMTTEFEHPLVLVVGTPIRTVEEMLPILEMVKKVKKPLVVFCMDLQDEPASTMIYNCKKGIVKCMAVNVPWAAGLEQDNLQDIAIITGATMIDNEHLHMLKDVSMEHFGTAKLIKVSDSETSIVDGGGNSESFLQRIEQIQEQVKAEPKQHMKNIHKERIARMKSQIAEIQVGGSSEVEQGEERDLIVDALNSAKSAITGGVLPGGGMAMYHASQLLQDGLPDQISDKSERIGAQILGQAMQMPLRRLIENKIGASDSVEHQIDKIMEEGDIFTGLDMRTMEVCDLMDRGVYDSFNVIKVILEDSISLAGMVITTECILIKEKNYKPLPLQHYQDRREFF